MSRAQILNREQECRDQQLGVEPGLSEQDFLLSASAIALSASSETAWLAIEEPNDRQGTRRPSSLGGSINEVNATLVITPH